MAILRSGRSTEIESIGQLIERSANADPASTALLAPGGGSLSYSELRDHVGAVSARLRERGIGPSDRVALLVENGPAAATAFLSLASAAACAPLNPDYRREELDFYLGDLEARAVVVSRSLESPVRAAAKERGILVLELDLAPDAPPGVFDLDGPLGVTERMPERGVDEQALLLHTSGTTARPKLVPLTHRNLAVSARNVATTLELRPSDRCLNVMPLFHIHGLVAALLASLHAGGSIACSPGFHPIHVFDRLRELEPTWYTAVPTMHHSMLARWAEHEDIVRSHRLRFVRSSSASLPVSVLEGLEQILAVPLVEAYGMTEAAHQMASNPLPPGERVPGSVGLAAGPQIAVLDASGDVLPPGSIGEVAIRGENVFSGYERNPEANAAAFVDGWFRTGDQGLLDESGVLSLRGRLKELINRGGEKIAPLEVDGRLLAHPSVAQAVTFAMPDTRLGEEVAAAVVLRPQQDADEPSLQDFVAQTLAPFKVPRRILFVDEIPKGPTGKVQRIGLADLLGASASERLEPRDATLPMSPLERDIEMVWSDVLGLPAVGLDDDFFDLGGDSILGAEAVARLRDLTGDDDLPLVSIVRAPSVHAMALELEKTVPALSSAGPIMLNGEAPGAPLFLVHGLGGEVLNLVALARCLDGERQVVGLRAHGLDHSPGATVTIEELASRYLEKIRSVQRHGPFVIGGLCMGAGIALELARLLEAQGEKIALLLLIDPRFARPRGLRYDLWLVPRRVREGRLAQALFGRMSIRQRRANLDEAQTATWHILERARESYRPVPCSSPAAVILSSNYLDFELPYSYIRSLLGNLRHWAHVGADHDEMLRHPAVDAVVAEVRLALALSGDGAT